MTKKRFLFVLFVLLGVSVILSCCGRRHRPYGRSTRVKRTTTSSKKLEGKKDTIYLIVPLPSGNPNESSNEGSEIIVPSSKKFKPLVHENGLPDSPQILFSRPAFVYSRDQYINYHNISGDMKELIIACDYDNFTVRNNAAALVSTSPGSFNLGQVCDIFDFCYINWSYVNDPITREYFAKASETLKNGLNGDCDDFAILVCSMILAVGGEARISFAYKNDEGHAFAEVNIGKTSRDKVEKYLFARYGKAELNHKKENGDWWLNLDWWGHCPGSEYWDYQRGTCFNIIRNAYYEF